VESLIIIDAMAFIALLPRIAKITAWARHVVDKVVVLLRKKPLLKNARLSDACQTLSAKPLMESALVSPDTAVPKPTALQQTWLSQRGVKV
jgi:hypothetical protein